MANTKGKTEEMPEGLKLIIKWILLVVGVPSLAGLFLYIVGVYSFEIATSGWQIFIGISLIVIWIIYEALIIKYLVEETRDYFK
jgi:hypothetical protein